MPPIEREFQTSFIPKKPLAEERVSREKPVSLLNVLATIIFFASIATGVGVYFYKLSLADSIKRMADDLDRAQAAFEPSLIYELQTLDRRLNASSQILDQHIAITPIMEELSVLTLKSVQFTEFKFESNPDGRGSVSISLRGKAKSYTSIALQSEEFKKQPAFIDPIFSNLSLDTKGNVLFDLNFDVDPDFISYKTSVSEEDITNNADIVE